MADINSLQELINSRAERKLDTQLTQIVEYIHQEILLAYESKEGPKLKVLDGLDKEGNEKWLDTTIYSLFRYGKYSHERSKFMDTLRAYHLPKFISNESELFLFTFDELTKTVDDIKNNQNDY